jgi:hypothetical protein
MRKTTKSVSCAPNLSPDIRTFLATQKGDFPIELSSGTVARPLSSRYERDAVVPVLPWRKPTPEEIAILTSAVIPKNYGAAISLISLPKPLLWPFESLRAIAARGGDNHELNIHLTGRAFHDAIQVVTNYVKANLQPDDITETPEEFEGGIYLRPPSQCTVTTDPTSGQHVGLHVDNWNNYSIANRGMAPNRIAINLGCEDRFFLFVNIAIGTMYEKIQALTRGIHHTTAIGRVFMTLFSSYPVVRLRIRPGEGYIAPTENIVHDASTIGATTWDITLSLRGRIALAPKN